MAGLFTTVQSSKPTAEMMSVTMERARLATAHAIARHVWNIATQDFQGNFFIASPFSFTDGLFFVARGFPTPTPDIAPPKTLNMCSPVFKDFGVLLSALSVQCMAKSYKTASYDGWRKIFDDIFGKWLGYGLSIPIGREQGSPPSPSAPSLFHIIDSSGLDTVKYPKCVQSSSEVFSGVAIPPTFEKVYTLMNTPLRPFYGKTLSVKWSPSIVDACASLVSSEIASTGIAITNPVEGMRNSWAIFTRVLIDALNTAVIITKPMDTQVYGVLNCPSTTPATVSGKIFWSTHK